MLDLKLLATFRDVAVRGSFSEAAVALGYTQPAVSQHVGRLERELGTRLLDRESRAVRPTPAGSGLLPEVARELRQTPVELDLRVIEHDPGLDDLRAGRLDVVLVIESD